MLQTLLVQPIQLACITFECSIYNIDEIVMFLLLVQTTFGAQTQFCRQHHAFKISTQQPLCIVSRPYIEKGGAP